ARSHNADALHQTGRRADAEERFREAEYWQAELPPHYPLLHAVHGFRYCDLLLGGAERAAWQQMQVPIANQKSNIDACRGVTKRAAQTRRWAEAEASNASILSIALECLTLVRASLYEAVLSGSSPSSVSQASQLTQVVSGLRRAGEQDYIPRALLTSAWCSH